MSFWLTLDLWLIYFCHFGGNGSHVLAVVVTLALLLFRLQLKIQKYEQREKTRKLKEHHTNLDIAWLNEELGQDGDFGGAVPSDANEEIPPTGQRSITITLPLDLFNKQNKSL